MPADPCSQGGTAPRSRAVSFRCADGAEGAADKRSTRR